MELIDLLPPKYDRNITMQTLQKLLGKATDDLENGLSNTISECFISTASSLLSRYEKMFGLKVSISESDAFRRERITAKMSGTGTVTKAMLMDVASRHSNGEVEITEDAPNHKFTVSFVGMLGIPQNMDGLKMTIEEIKPAHLAAEYEYFYNTWNDISHMTWDEASAYTWEGIRTVNL